MFLIYTVTIQFRVNAGPVHHNYARNSDDIYYCAQQKCVRSRTSFSRQRVVNSTKTIINRINDFKVQLVKITANLFHSLLNWCRLLVIIMRQILQ